MKTKVIVLAAAIGLGLLATPAQAAPAKTLVIIDTGINSNLDWVKNSLVEEACFIQYGKCPNGQASMTGPGAASLNPSLIKDKTLSHGTQMASVAVTVNPSVKIVMVRIVGMTDKGYATSYNTQGLAVAMDWVTANTERLNIGAISISLGRTYKEAACPIEQKLQTQIETLAALNVATVIAAGNNSNQTKINYPACIPAAIAVGATDTPYTVKQVQGTVYPVMLISNSSAELDIYALGRYTTSDVSGVRTVTLGTSNATVAVASKLAQMLSEGNTLSDTMAKVNGSLQKAYRSLTDVVTKYFQL